MSNVPPNDGIIQMMANVCGFENVISNHIVGVCVGTLVEYYYTIDASDIT